MKYRWSYYAAVCTLLLVNAVPAQSVIEQRSLRSLRKMFGDSVSVSSARVVLSPADRDSIARAAGSSWSSDTLRVFSCRCEDSTVGFGFVDDVKGKTQLITYLTGIRPTGEVQDIDVLAYRESYGGEISYESFRKQFREKTSKDALLPGRDIRNISGATISVRAITTGVKKILATFSLLKHRLPR